MRVTKIVLAVVFGICTVSCSTAHDQVGGKPMDSNALDAQSQRAMTLEIQSVRKELEATKVALANEKAARQKDNDACLAALAAKDAEKKRELDALNAKWNGTTITLTLYDDADFGGQYWTQDVGINGGAISNFADWKGSAQNNANDRTSSAKITVKHP